MRRVYVLRLKKANAERCRFARRHWPKYERQPQTLEYVNTGDGTPASPSGEM